MKMKLILIAVASTLGNVAFASPAQIGICDLNKIFKDSSYIQTANKALQDNVKSMQDKLLEAQKKLQASAENLQKNRAKMTADEQVKASADIALQQVAFNKMNQEFSEKIRQEQSEDMKKFLTMVKKAGEKVAQEKHLDAVFTNNETVYATSAIDVTHAIETVLAQNEK